VVLLGVTRIQSRPTWRGAVCDPSHWAQLHLIEHSGAPHASWPSRHLRSRGLPSWTGNRQLASSRSSTPPARFGRATDAAGPDHHGLGSSPIGVPISDAIRRIRRCTPCVCVCVCVCVCLCSTVDTESQPLLAVFSCDFITCIIIIYYAEAARTCRATINYTTTIQW